MYSSVRRMCPSTHTPSKSDKCTFRRVMRVLATHLPNMLISSVEKPARTPRRCASLVSPSTAGRGGGGRGQWKRGNGETGKRRGSWKRKGKSSVRKPDKGKWEREGQKEKEKSKKQVRRNKGMRKAESLFMERIESEMKANILQGKVERGQERK